MTEKTYTLAAPIRKTCDLFRLLAGHEVLGLAPGGAVRRKFRMAPMPAAAAIFAQEAVFSLSQAGIAMPTTLPPPSTRGAPGSGSSVAVAASEN